MRPGFLYLGGELQQTRPRSQRLAHCQGPFGVVCTPMPELLAVEVSLPFQPFSGREQRLFSVLSPSEESRVCWPVCFPDVSTGVKRQQTSARGFVFPLSGLPPGCTTHLYIEPGRFRGLILSVPSIKWFKFQILRSSKPLLSIKALR